jgi:hypothetical protein
LNNFDSLRNAAQSLRPGSVDKMIGCGTPWRDVPEKYGNWNSIYRRFRRQGKTGTRSVIRRYFLLRYYHTPRRRPRSGTDLS